MLKFLFVSEQLYFSYAHAGSKQTNKQKLQEGWVWKFVPDLGNSIWQNVTSEFHFDYFTLCSPVHGEAILVNLLYNDMYLASILNSVE